MKPILSALILCVLVSVYAQGQTKPAAKPAAKLAGDCFKQWYSLFKERGATPVPDGVNDVIITLRNNEYTECFMGRIEVSNGRLPEGSRFRRLTDRMKSSTKE